MCRLPRIKIPDQIYSVVTQTNEKKFIFKDKAVCEEFLIQLKRAKNKHKFKLYAFEIMPTHVHLCIEPNDKQADISTIMRTINGNFAMKYNSVLKRYGRFWRGRFKSKIIQDKVHLIRTIVYFALNPIRAGIKKGILEYEFSSIHSMYSGKYTDLIDPLPRRYEQLIKDFFERKNYLSNIFKKDIAKLNRIMKKYSFNLTRSKEDQRYRHFIGNRYYPEMLFSNKTVNST